MGAAEARIVVMIIELLVTRGIPVALDVIDRWRKEDPTMSDWKALKAEMKHPDDFD